LEELLASLEAGGGNRRRKLQDAAADPFAGMNIEELRA
jgi:hypothetical protein